MAVPELDALRIRRWCRARVPEHLWAQVRVECEITDRHVTIIETRPPWDSSEAEWTRFPIARLVSNGDRPGRRPAPLYH